MRAREGVLKLKSVEFLISLFLLLWLFTFLYADARQYVALSEDRLAELNESLRVRAARSMVRGMIAYGSPFEFSDFPNVPPEKLGIPYDPATDTYTYKTYPRW